jgi:hypothetical protein
MHRTKIRNFQSIFSHNFFIPQSLREKKKVRASKKLVHLNGSISRQQSKKIEREEEIDGKRGRKTEKDRGCEREVKDREIEVEKEKKERERGIERERKRGRGEFEIQG